MLTILAYEYIHNVEYILPEVVKNLTIGNVIKFSNYKSSVLHTELRVSTLVLFINISIVIIIMMMMMIMMIIIIVVVITISIIIVIIIIMW